MADFNFKGVWVPAKVFTDPRLTHADKFLFALVHILSNEKGCFATRETLSSYMCQSVRNTQYSISRLSDCGYIRKDPDGTLWDIVSACLEGEEKFMPKVQGIADEPCRNLHPYSNKDRNKITKRVQDTPVEDTFIKTDKDLSKAWDQWLAYRKEKRWTVSTHYINNWNKQFESWGSQKAVHAITQSMLQGWQGLFEPKVGIQTRAQAPKADSDHARGF